MNRIFSISVLLLLAVVSFAQTTQYLWPISGHLQGEGVLVRPNDYVDGKKNKDQLIIGGTLEEFVIAPVEGVVNTFNYLYNSSLTSSDFIGYTPTESWQNDVSAIQHLFPNKNYAPRCISLTVGIKTTDGAVVYIQGIRPVKVLKTGQRIHRGDTIGQVGYFCYKISEPAVSVAVSKDGVSADPMSPFGLKSTFKSFPYKKVTALSQAQALEDVDYLVETLEEIYPGLYDYCTPQQWDSVIIMTKSSVSDNITYENFYRVVQDLTFYQHDNHLLLNTIRRSKYNESNYKLPAAAFGIVNDSLKIIRTMPEYEDFFGKHIISVNGIPEDSVKMIIRSHQYLSDGLVKSTSLYDIMVWGCQRFNYDDSKDDYDLQLEDGNHIRYSLLATPSKGKRVCKAYTQNWMDHFFWNNELTTKILNDSTAYLGLYSFILDDMEIDTIRRFIRRLNDLDVPYLMIDVRNNAGGDERTEAKLFSFFTDAPFQLYESKYVKKQRDFQFLTHCINLPEDIELFAEYVPNSSGGFSLEERETYHPDSTSHFDGEVLVLTDHRTLSAAASFAFLFKKYQRGKIVGRETGSAIAQLNADKFAYITLPNSNIEIAVPMVKIVIDKDCSIVQPGRGVMPDVEIPLTLDELSSGNPDKVVKQCLRCF